MRAEPCAQRRVHEVRRRVVEPRGLAARGVDRESHAVADADRALPHDAPVHDGRAAELVRVEHLDARPASLVIQPRSPTWPPDSA